MLNSGLGYIMENKILMGSLRNIMDPMSNWGFRPARDEYSELDASAWNWLWQGLEESVEHHLHPRTRPKRLLLELKVVEANSPLA